MKLHEYNPDKDAFSEFRIQCDACSGLCCVALYYSKCDGFPIDKAAGTPCFHLDDHFRCAIHQELNAKHMKGCMAYDCCGAGQIVTSLYQDNWKSNSYRAQEIYDSFMRVFDLQQILWFLSEILTLPAAKTLWKEAAAYIGEIHLLLASSPTHLLTFDIDDLGKKVAMMLDRAWTMVKKEVGYPQNTNKKRDLVGHNFGKANLIGSDFRSALLIAANLEGCDLTGCNFLGADFRDAMIKEADLSESLFLTQGQLNAAIGNINTRIPEHLIRPSTWI